MDRRWEKIKIGFKSLIGKNQTTTKLLKDNEILKMLL